MVLKYSDEVASSQPAGLGHKQLPSRRRYGVPVSVTCRSSTIVAREGGGAGWGVK